jgi:hypothetical protein
MGHTYVDDGDLPFQTAVARTLHLDKFNASGA